MSEQMSGKKDKPVHEKELKNSYRDNLNITALREDVNALKVDLTNFVGALLQSGVVELVKDEEGNIIYKINKVVLVDESVQQD
jgi:hypothetical protein